MAPDSNNKGAHDVFADKHLFPDAAAVFAWRPKPVEDIKDECTVVLDTNVLLVPYTINPKSLDQIGQTYESLIEQGRIVVPGQVAREFARLRAAKLGELAHQLNEKKSNLPQFQKGQQPLFERVPEYEHVVRLEKELDERIGQYREAVGQVVEHVRHWTWNDPVSLLYGSLFTNTVVHDPELDEDDMRKDFARRQKHKIPPGYKDKNAGDLLIWRTILKLGEERASDLIFVSNDEKADWWHQSEGALYPRYELVDEYRRRSVGRSFHILKLPQFLDLYGVDEEVVEEVRRAGRGGQVIQVQIGNTKKTLEEISASWINEQIVRRRRDGESICVQVFIDNPSVHIRLSTPDCPGSIGGRPATPSEQEIFDLWERHGLNESDFTGGNLVAFLRRVS